MLGRKLKQWECLLILGSQFSISVFQKQTLITVLLNVFMNIQGGFQVKQCHNLTATR